MNNSVFVAG